MPRQALGDPEQTQQNSAVNHSPASTVVKSDKQRERQREAVAAEHWERLCMASQRVGTLAVLGKQALHPPSPARTRLDETLGLGDGAVCRAIS